MYLLIPTALEFMGPIFRTFFPGKIPRKIFPQKMLGKIGIFRKKSFKKLCTLEGIRTDDLPFLKLMRCISLRHSNYFLNV
jgi:hypothetical protein